MGSEFTAKAGFTGELLWTTLAMISVPNFKRTASGIRLPARDAIRQNSPVSGPSISAKALAAVLTKPNLSIWKSIGSLVPSGGGRIISSVGRLDVHRERQVRVFAGLQLEVFSRSFEFVAGHDPPIPGGWPILSIRDYTPVIPAGAWPGSPARSHP